MRRYRHQLLFAAMLVVATITGIAGCAAPAPVHLHTLMPATLAPRDDSAAAGQSAIAVVLEPVRLPAQVDQPQWLVRLPDGSLAALEQERWASPLRDEFRQALLEEMILHSGVVEASATVAGAAPPIRIAVDVRRFDSIPGREARIEGSWNLTSDRSPAQVWHCDWLLREPAESGFAPLAAAHRRAVVRLADGIGESVRAMQSGAPAVCPKSDPR
jgi:hypothetical protein